MISSCPFSRQTTGKIANEANPHRRQRRFTVENNGFARLIRVDFTRRAFGVANGQHRNIVIVDFFVMNLNRWWRALRCRCFSSNAPVYLQHLFVICISETLLLIGTVITEKIFLYNRFLQRETNAFDFSPRRSIGITLPAIFVSWYCRMWPPWQNS